MARSLHYLASKRGPVTAEQLKQIQRWIDADWESHDVDRDAVRLIARLASTLRAAQSHRRLAKTIRAMVKP